MEIKEEKKCLVIVISISISFINTRIYSEY